MQDLIVALNVIRTPGGMSPLRSRNTRWRDDESARRRAAFEPTNRRKEGWRSGVRVWVRTYAPLMQPVAYQRPWAASGTGRMRSSAGTRTGLEPDLWIVAEALASSAPSENTNAIVRATRARRSLLGEPESALGLHHAGPGRTLCRLICSRGLRSCPGLTVPFGACRRRSRSKKRREPHEKLISAASCTVSAAEELQTLLR